MPAVCSTSTVLRPTAGAAPGRNSTRRFHRPPSTGKGMEEMHAMIICDIPIQPLVFEERTVDETEVPILRILQITVSPCPLAQLISDRSPRQVEEYVQEKWDDMDDETRIWFQNKVRVLLMNFYHIRFHIRPLLSLTCSPKGNWLRITKTRAAYLSCSHPKR